MQSKTRTLLVHCIRSVLFDCIQKSASDLEIVEHNISEILRLRLLAPDCAHKLRERFLCDLHDAAEDFLGSRADILRFFREIIFDRDSLGFIADRELDKAVFIVHTVCDPEHIAAVILLEADEMRNADRNIICLVAGDEIYSKCGIIHNHGSNDAVCFIVLLNVKMDVIFIEKIRDFFDCRIHVQFPLP